MKGVDQNSAEVNCWKIHSRLLWENLILARGKNLPSLILTCWNFQTDKDNISAIKWRTYTFFFSCTILVSFSFNSHTKSIITILFTCIRQKWGQKGTYQNEVNSPRLHLIKKRFIAFEIRRYLISKVCYLCWWLLIQIADYVWK